MDSKRARARRGTVFISYKREDHERAAQVRDAVSRAGFTVWWDADLQCGKKWAHELDLQVAEAGAIIVLWSKLAVASDWVQHEASQAMVRGVYAPCRIELVKIPSPYDDDFTVDLLEWAGEADHAGLRNLLRRVGELLPPPRSLAARIVGWLRPRVSAVVFFAIALAAILLLLKQAAVSERLVKQSERILHPPPRDLFFAIEASLGPDSDAVQACSRRLKALKEELAAAREGPGGASAVRAPNLEPDRDAAGERVLWEVSRAVRIRFVAPRSGASPAESERLSVVDYGGAEIEGQEWHPREDGGLDWYIWVSLSEIDVLEEVRSMKELLSRPLEVAFGPSGLGAPDRPALRSIAGAMRLTAVTIRTHNTRFVCLPKAGAVERGMPDEHGYFSFTVSGPWRE